jgi:hypothetical protein
VQSFLRGRARDVSARGHVRGSSRPDRAAMFPGRDDYGLREGKAARVQYPAADGGMRLGEVRIVPFQGAENVASYVAWAASVADFSSRLEAIEDIGRILGAFTREAPGVEVVSAPPLGAGAGGLPSANVVERLRDGFLTEAAARPHFRFSSGGRSFSRRCARASRRAEKLLTARRRSRSASS